MSEANQAQERQRLRFILITLTIVATWIVVNGFFFTGWRTAAILAFGMLIIDVLYIIWMDDRLLAKFLFFGLAAGFIELLADAWLVAGTKTLFYEHGEPLLLESPVYMPVAWAVILVQIGYLGYTFYRRWGLLTATVLTGLLGGAIIPVYEASAKGAGWWLYEDTHRMLFGAAPYYIILGEFLLALALPFLFLAVQRRPFYWTLPYGAAMGLWIWASYFISFQLVG
jgi:heme/copper-type cytochrome/quinol oxidase subunit 4